MAPGIRISTERHLSTYCCRAKKPPKNTFFCPNSSVSSCFYSCCDRHLFANNFFFGTEPSVAVGLSCTLAQFGGIIDVTKFVFATEFTEKAPTAHSFSFSRSSSFTGPASLSFSLWMTNAHFPQNMGSTFNLCGISKAIF